MAAEPLEGSIAARRRRTLQDLKPLLKDRGCDESDNLGISVSENSNLVLVSQFRRWPRIQYLGCLAAVFMVFLLGCPVTARSAEPRYETAYACESKTLKIGCPEGTVINLIRANYGRFSITICNDHGNTDWSVNCMSTRSLRVLHNRCSNNQNCSILASTTMFGDPCPNTLKYLEAHYQCVTASPSTSTTTRPSPPWLVTSQPSVWRSTQPSPAKTQGSVPQPAGERRKPTVITPPTFRPHITFPPEVKPGDVGSKKTTTKLPEQVQIEKVPKESETEVKVEVVVEPDENIAGVERIPGNGNSAGSKSGDEADVRDIDPRWPTNGESEKPIQSAELPAKEDDLPPSPNFADDFSRNYDSGSLNTQPPPTHSYCAPVSSRGLHWNWTVAGKFAVQPCPGGATGLARWRCTLSPNQLQPRQPPPVRRGLQTGENYHDLGLDRPDDKQLQLMRRLGHESLLKGRGGEDPRDLRGNPELTSGSLGLTEFDYDAVPVWFGETPDLSECRSVWLNSLEARVKDGESLLSISNDLSQVTSSKTLYGGDMMTTTSIMKKLAQRMSQNVQTFPDSGQRVAILTDMLHGVIKTGSNLLDESQRASWNDLNHETQMRAATALLTQLEENAFLLADSIKSEKNIIQTVKHICISVRVLEVRNVDDVSFPSALARDQWKATDDVITIPRAALLENRENDLVRIVFVAFDRLEEILQPLHHEPVVTPTMPSVVSAQNSATLSTQRERTNVTRVLNSKVISASLGKGRHIQLSQMVKMTLRHLRTENVSNPTCVFWDYTVNVWSTEGCQVESTNKTHTVCSCTHLTNFAILMDVHSLSLDKTNALALRVITLIGCCVSVIALTASVVVFHCFRNMKSDRVTIHKNLCVCLLIAELVFMIGIDQTQSRIMCGVIAGMLHYFFLAAFAWMFLEGFHLYAMLVEVFEPERPRARWYCICAYSVPAIIVITSALVNPSGYGTPDHCWLSTHNMFILSFIGPVAVVLTANWICLAMVVYMMCHHSSVSIKSKDNSKLYKIRVWMNSSLVLVFLLGLTWTFGLLYLNEQSLGIAYAFTILNSLQGLFIFVFHCLQNEIFQKECARICRRHPWLSCCLALTGNTHNTTTGNHNQQTASSSNNAPMDGTLRQGSMKGRRYHHSDVTDDSMEPRDVSNYKLQPETRWPTLRPTAPLYDTNEVRQSMTGQALDGYRTSTPQIPNSASHPHSIASMHSYRHLESGDYGSTRSRSPSCFSSNLTDWSAGGGQVKQNTSSKHIHHGTMGHHDTLSRQMNHIHTGYMDCEATAANSPHHDHPHVHSGYHTTRSYDMRNPHIYMPQPGSQEMITRKHYGKNEEGRRRQPNHTYQEIAGQQTRIYRRPSEHEFRHAQDDPVYEEIERNETLMSDVSDDNSGPDCVRPTKLPTKFYADHRPLISYSPGERHEEYLKYGRNKWDSLERNFDRHPYDGRVVHHPYPQENNMRALAAVLNGENNVVCHLEPPNSYDVYPGQGNSRTVTQPSF